MLYRLLADLMLLLHLLFIIFAIFGGLTLLWRRRMVYVHLPAAAWGVLVEVMNWRCPLTNWENYFRRLAGGQGYSESFVEHYLLPIIYPPGLTPKNLMIIGLLVLLINLVIYCYVYLVLKRRA